ncbi:MAG: hypothetical protein QG597_3525 [Actinomycetota bacterium]|nr:hypothetical protein [Actinomycetota bacterium]
MIRRISPSLPISLSLPKWRPTPVGHRSHTPHNIRFSPTARARARVVLRSAACAVALIVVWAVPAYAASPDSGSATARLDTILANATAWLVGILAALATLFLTIGGVRYVAAGGDPGEIEKAKGAFKSAGLGYAMALLAPLVVSIIKGLLGV